MSNINNVFDVNKELIYFKRLNFDCVDWEKSVGIKFEILYLNKKYFIKILLYDRINQSVNIEIDGKHNIIRTASLRNLRLRNYIKVGQDGNHKLNDEDFIKVCKDRNSNLEKIETEYNKYFACWKCGHSKESKRTLLLQGVDCPYCSGHKVLVGYNDINTTKTFIYDFLYDKNDGYKYSKNSIHKLHLKCPKCNFEFYRKITSIKDMLKCPNCQTNNFSFPENVIFNMLTQFNLFFEHELSFTWSKNKRYDFYIPSLNCIIEAHGLQHYKNSFEKVCGRKLEDEEDNDKIKENLAKEHGIDIYIQLDCRKSSISWIKKSVEYSELKNILNLREVDWDKCLEFANRNLAYDICVLWDNSISTTEFSKINKIDRSTLVKYLKIGEEYGWCNFDRNKQKNMRYEKVSDSLRKEVLVVFNKKEYVFKSLAELEEKSMEIFGTKLYKSSVSRICRGLQSQFKDFYIKYSFKSLTD